jgi:hypothetical protein
LILADLPPADTSSKLTPAEPGVKPAELEGEATTETPMAEMMADMDARYDKDSMLLDIIASVRQVKQCLIV